MITRKTAREQTFILIFERSFNDLSVDEILELATECKDFEIDDYVKSVFSGVFENIEEIDADISNNAVAWEINRIGRVALSILRLAIFEIKFRDDIPINVSINEAVELAKKYATAEDASFINGILGSIAKAQKTEA